MNRALLGLIVAGVDRAETGPVELVIGLISATCRCHLCDVAAVDRLWQSDALDFATAFFGVHWFLFHRLRFNTSIEIVATVATHNQQIGENVAPYPAPIGKRAPRP